MGPNDVNEHRQAVDTDILIDGCLFEDSYASNEGGGLHHGTGQLSVLRSVFYNSSAGNGNIEDGELSSREHSGRNWGGVLSMSSTQLAWTTYMH